MSLRKELIMADRSIKDFVYQAGARKRIPVSGTFELTPRCNFNCKMCYVHMTPEEQKAYGRELSTEEWLTIGRRAVEAGMIYLLLTGGEPMLRQDFVTLYGELIQMGLVISVNTNGTLITPEMVECFRKHPPETVNVTLYGASSETYAKLCGVKGGYEKALNGIRALKQAGIRVALNTTFTACNQGDMEALIALAKELELPIRTAAYTFPPVRNRHEDSGVCLLPEEQAKLNARFEFLATIALRRKTKADYLRRCLEAELSRDPNAVDGQGKPSSCMAGRGAFWMSWNGEMYPCGMLADYAVRSHGDFSDFTDMWRQICERTESVYLPAACGECALRRVCPSCAAVTYSYSGDSRRLMEGMCVYTRAYVRAYLELTEAENETTPEGINRGDADPFVCL